MNILAKRALDCRTTVPQGADFCIAASRPPLRAPFSSDTSLVYNLRVTAANGERRKQPGRIHRTKLSVNTPTARTAASHVTKGYLIALVGTAIWSTTAIFIRYLTTSYALPPLVLAFWRDLFVAAGLAVALAVFNPRSLRANRSHWKFLLVYGFVLSIFNALWTVAVALDGAAVATVLAYNSPAFTALLAWRFLGERLLPAKIVAILLSMAGCILVSGAYNLAVWRVNPLGIAAGLLAGLAFAVYSIMGKTAAQRSMPAWSTLLYIFLGAAAFLLLYQLIPALIPGSGRSLDLLALGGSSTGWAVLAALALGPTIGGYGLYSVSLTYLPASVANLIATLEPTMTAALAYFLLGETFTPLQVVGGILVLLGVVILRVWGR
jgi:drug/metabolite transporter (DMT)-like permease